MCACVKAEMGMSCFPTVSPFEQGLFTEPFLQPGMLGCEPQGSWGKECMGQLLWSKECMGQLFLVFHGVAGDSNSDVLVQDVLVSQEPPGISPDLKMDFIFLGFIFSRQGFSV